MSAVIEAVRENPIAVVRPPFHRELDDLFRSDKLIILKVLGGAFVGAFFAFKGANQNRAGFSDTMKAVTVGGGALAGALAVVILSLREVVMRRVAEGRRVNPLLRVYFGQGEGCLSVTLTALLWGITVIALTFIVIMLTLGL